MNAQVETDPGAEVFKDRMRRLFDSQYRAGYRDGENAMKPKAYKEGYLFGYTCGESAGLLNLKRARDRALGVGLLVGTGIGVVLAVAVIGWLA